MKYRTVVHNKISYEVPKFEDFEDLSDAMSKPEIVSYVNESIKTYQVVSKLVKTATKLDTTKIKPAIINTAFSNVDSSILKLKRQVKKLLDNKVNRKVIYDSMSVDKDFVDAVVNE